ncbi:uncharacterized protein [Procambarus clarkii]|uniref:uncharacterized protein isoform X1 n=1 Tax=Procambarus clarkii TaxID=6728 RepID=UPI0037441D99
MTRRDTQTGSKCSYSDESAATILKNYAKCEELKPEDKIRKIIVLHYPLHMALGHLEKLNYVVSAERCQVRTTKQETRQVLLTVRGRIPEKLDLGIWGVFQHRPYTPEPLRCFRCQRFGHHKDGCQRPVRCGVCSQPHDTKTCIDKHKANHPVQAKCPNCSKAHHAWNLKCPERLKRLQTNPTTPTAEPKPPPKRIPAPMPTKTAWGLPIQEVGAHGLSPSAMVKGEKTSVQDKKKDGGHKNHVQSSRPPISSSKHTGANINNSSVKVTTEKGLKATRPQTSTTLISAPTELDALWPMLKTLVTELIKSLLSSHGIKQTTETRKTIEHKLKKFEDVISTPSRQQGRRHPHKKQIESSSSESDIDEPISGPLRTYTPIATSMACSSDSMDTTELSANSKNLEV